METTLADYRGFIVFGFAGLKALRGDRCVLPDCDKNNRVMRCFIATEKMIQRASNERWTYWQPRGRDPFWTTPEGVVFECPTIDENLVFTFEEKGVEFRAFTYNVYKTLVEDCMIFNTVPEIIMKHLPDVDPFVIEAKEREKKEKFERDEKRVMDVLEAAGKSLEDPAVRELLEECSRFDYFYDYIDDGKKWRHWNEKEINLKKKLADNNLSGLFNVCFLIAQGK